MIFVYFQIITKAMTGHAESGVKKANRTGAVYSDMECGPEREREM